MSLGCPSLHLAPRQAALISALGFRAYARDIGDNLIVGKTANECILCFGHRGGFRGFCVSTVRLRCELDGRSLRDVLAHFAYSVQLLMFRPTHFGGLAAGYFCASLQSTRRHFLRRVRWDAEADAWLGVIKKFNS